MLAKLLAKLTEKKKTTEQQFANRTHDGSVYHSTVVGYISPETMITKNGELLQTIQINCYENKYNIDGILTKNIHEAIAKIYSDADQRLAFWIHTIRTSTPDTAIYNRVDRGALYNRVAKIWHQFSNTQLNHHRTVFYVTVLVQSKNLSINFSKILLSTSAKTLSRAHNLYLKRSMSQLTAATDRILEAYANWDVKRLSIVHDDTNDYYSEHLTMFSSFVNFDNHKYQLDTKNLSSLLCRSVYKFKFNYGVAICDNKTTFFAAYSVKETNLMSQRGIVDMIALLGDVIICEVFHEENFGIVTDHYKVQNDYIDATNTKELASIINIDQFKKSATTKVYKRCIAIIVKGRTQQALSQQMGKMVSAAKKVGLIITQEDIALERVLNLMMPGNFQYTARYDYVSIDSLCRFAYAYTMDHKIMERYIGQVSMMMLSTVKKNPYPFGYLDVDSNIALCGSGNHVMFTNLILVFSQIYQPKIYIIDPYYGSDSFVLAMNGATYECSIDADHNKYMMNMMQILNSFESKDIIEEWLYNVSIISDPTISNEIGDAAKNLANIAENMRFNSISQLIENAKDNSIIGDAIRHWHGNGKASHIFNNDVNCIDNDLQTIRISIDEQTMNSPIARGIIICSTLLNIISQKSDQLKIIVLHDIAVLLENDYARSYALKLINSLNENNAICIFSLSTKSIVTGTDILKIFIHCKTKIHMDFRKMDKDYFELFDIPSDTVNTIRDSNDSNNTAIMQHENDVIPLDLNVSFMNKKILDLLYDNYEVQTNIKNIIKIHGNDASQWLQHLLDPKINESDTNNNNVTDKSSFEMF